MQPTWSASKRATSWRSGSRGPGARCRRRAAVRGLRAAGRRLRQRPGAGSPRGAGGGGGGQEALEERRQGEGGSWGAGAKAAWRTRPQRAAGGGGGEQEEPATACGSRPGRPAPGEGGGAPAAGHQGQGQRQLVGVEYVDERGQLLPLAGAGQRQGRGGRSRETDRAGGARAAALAAGPAGASGRRGACCGGAPAGEPCPSPESAAAADKCAKAAPQAVAHAVPAEGGEGPGQQAERLESPAAGGGGDCGLGAAAAAPG
jgi:hypothetical protein